MTSLVSEELSRSKDEPLEKRDSRPKMSLANDNVDPRNSLQNMNLPPKSKKPIDKIHTFIIWSIFNLLFLPFGILCCYFSYKVNQFKIQNRYEMAKKWSRRASVINIITTLLMFGVIITAFMLHYDFAHSNSNIQPNQTQTTGAYIPWQPGR